MIVSPLLVVTDRHCAGRPLTETVRAVLDGGARWVWFRDRDLEAAARRDLAAELLAFVREAGGHLSIGGDVELAAAIGADGVHLSGMTFDRLDPIRLLGDASDQARISSPRMRGEGVTAASNAISAARCALGSNALIGLSAHSLADVRAAARADADYVTLSPIYSTSSKPGYGPALGLDALRAAADIGIPVIALGGIGPAQARACRAAGAAGVAVMGGLMRAEDPAVQTRALLAALR